MQSLAEIWGLVFPGPLYMTAKSAMYIFSAHARFTLHLSNQLSVLIFAFYISLYPCFTVGIA